MTTHVPADPGEVREVVGSAFAERRPVEIVGRGTKRGLGRPLQLEHVLDVSRLSGIVDYEPSELVLTAQAGTPLAEIEAALSSHNQILAFEPPDLAALLGSTPVEQTLAGVLACNLAGPRRIKAGAARDHFLGFHAVNGRAQLFKAGGKVVKNVTGYDLCKLMCGSYGTLAVLTEAAMKVLPRPEKARTVLLLGATDRDAIAALAKALNSPHEVSAAAHLPVPIGGRSSVSHVNGAGVAVTAVRIEGPGPSVTHRCERVHEVLAEFGPTEELHTENSARFWREVADVSAFAAMPDRAVWRISVAPSVAAALVGRIERTLDALSYYDWGGGLVWLAIRDLQDGGASVIRPALSATEGHATLVRAPVGVRATVDVFQPLSPALARLTAQVKAGFDPENILNPGRVHRPS
jgi:glycolate oxidase FAD binding subunit